LYPFEAPRPLPFSKSFESRAVRSLLRQPILKDFIDDPAGVLPVDTGSFVLDEFVMVVHRVNCVVSSDVLPWLDGLKLPEVLVGDAVSFIVESLRVPAGASEPCCYCFAYGCSPLGCAALR